MGVPQGWELLLVLLVILLLFGAKRLPDTARGLGRSLRIFKAETKGLRADEGDAPAAPVASARVDERVVRRTDADIAGRPDAQPGEREDVVIRETRVIESSPEARVRPVQHDTTER